MDLLRLLRECYNFIKSGKKSHGQTFIYDLTPNGAPAGIAISYIMKAYRLKYKLACDLVEAKVGSLWIPFDWGEQFESVSDLELKMSRLPGGDESD